MKWITFDNYVTSKVYVVIFLGTVAVVFGVSAVGNSCSTNQIAAFPFRL